MFKNKSNKITKSEWIILGIFFVVSFSIFIYSDICHTTSRGIVFWDCLFEGRLNEFYAYPYPGVEGSYLPKGTFTGAYDILLYVIFALWDFPLWCFEKITQTSFLSVYGGRLYAKCIVLVFFVVAAWIFRKIAFLLTENEDLSNWAVFLFGSSSLVMSAIVIQGGYDIISVCFTLLGIYLYLQDEDWKFVFAFAIAATCKMFALFIFVPLLLLRCKNIPKILGRVLVSISLIAIPKIITGVGNVIVSILKRNNLIDASEQITAMQTNILLASNNADFTISSNAVIAHSNIINDNMFTNNGAAIGFGDIPLFFFFTLLFWWWCWKKKQSTRYEIIYSCLIGMGIFSLFVDVNPYWIILLVPYVILILISNVDKLRDNIILETLFSLGFVMLQAHKRYWCYSFEMFTKMFEIDPGVIKDYRICGIVKVVNTLHEIVGISVQNIYSLFVCCFALGLILFMYDNRPSALIKQEPDFAVIRTWSWVRMVPAIIVILLPFSEVVIYYIKVLFGVV